MSVDIFKFWSEIKPDETIHPADYDVMSRTAHNFKTACLPASFMGPLRHAPIVLLYLSPGLSDEDFIEAKSKQGQDRYARQRKGDALLPSENEFKPAWRWWFSRCQRFGDSELIRRKVAVLNIGAYHSKSFSDWGLLAALPSSRVSIDWAQRNLYPDAIVGKRVVICLRAAKYWGLLEGKKYGQTLYAPKVTRAGHMCKTALRTEIIENVQRVLTTVSF